MLASVASLLLAGVVAVAVFFTTRYVGRPQPKRTLLLLLLLPVLFQLPAFTSGRTLLPADHTAQAPPWRYVTFPEPQRNPYLNDVAFQFVPWTEAVRRSYAEGSLPLRNRWNGCGLPLGANGQSSAFAPWTLLTLFLPVANAFASLALIKLFLASTGTYLWLRELGSSSYAAAFGAVCFSLSFTIIPWVFMVHTSVIALWPWMFFGIELLRDAEVRRRAIALLTVVFALMALGGHIESVVSGSLFAAIFLLTRLLLGDLPGAGRLFRGIAVAAALALGLTAFLLLPHIGAILASNRMLLVERPFWSDVLSWRPHGPVRWGPFFTTFFPRALGDDIAAPRISPAFAAFPEMALGYSGILVWCCALLLFRPGPARRKTKWALLLPVLAALGVASGLWPFAEIFSFLPGVRLMLPARFLAWGALGGVALAALELDRLEKDLTAGSKRRLWALVVPVALALFAFALYLELRGKHMSTGGSPAFTEATLAAVALCALFTILLVVRFSRSISLGLALIPFAAAELFYQGARQYAWQAPGDLFPDTPLLAFLRDRPGTFRVLGEGPVLFPGSHITAGLEDIRTHDPVERRDYVAFLDATCGYTPTDYFKTVVNVNAPVLDFLNVRYLVSSPGRASPSAKWTLVYSGVDGTVFENRTALPRFYVPLSVEWVPPEPGVSRWDNWGRFKDAHARIAGTKDWSKVSFLLGEGQVSSVAVSPVTVEAYRETTNRISFHARAQETPAFLVSSVVDDGGWSARTGDGRRLQTFRANGPFLALRVPPGENEIHLTYSPPGFRAGSGISFGTLIVAAALALRSRQERLRKRARFRGP